MFPVQRELKLKKLYGKAIGVEKMGDDDPQPQIVCGLYEVSTIEACGRMETVAFKISGFGPDQIADPQHVKTLEEWTL